MKPRLIRKNRIQCFSLLEVLIALALIAVALPLLISPFVYMSQDLREEIRTINLEKLASLSISSLLVDLHTNKIPLTALDSPEEYPAPFEWYKELGLKEDEFRASYQFSVTSSNREEENKVRNELWLVSFTLQLRGQKEPTKFEYPFIVAGDIPK